MPNPIALSRTQDTIASLNPFAYFSAHIYGWMPSGNPLPLWADISGNKNNALKINASAPTVLTNQLNGKPVVNFTGGSSQAYSTLANTGISGTSGRTLFVVSKDYNTGGGFPATIGIGGSTTSTAFVLEYFNTNLYLDIVGSSVSVATATSWNIYAAKLNANNYGQLWKNGSIVGTGNVVVNTTNSPITMGRFTSSYLNTKVAASLCFTSNLSDANMVAVFNQLNSIWGVY